jgi:hypothetical protein
MRLFSHITHTHTHSSLLCPHTHTNAHIEAELYDLFFTVSVEDTLMHAVKVVLPLPKATLSCSFFAPPHRP